MLKYSYLLAFSIVLFSLSACSSGKVAAPAQPNTRLQQAVASEPKKPRLKINHSVHILTYASASRDRCMSAFDEAGILLKKFYDGSQESLKQGLIENQENIHAELMKIKEKVQKNSAETVPRLTQLLKSDDAFIANMEQAVAACDNSLLSLIDMVTSDTDVFPADGQVLPAEIVSERYNRIVNPQLIALEMLYTFEANEYADYDAWLSAQYQFVLMMQHVYKELQIVANNPEHEQAEEVIEVEYQGDTLEIGFNVGYLLDVLNTLGTDLVILHLNDANSSALVEGVGNVGASYVVMPMRL